MNEKERLQEIRRLTDRLNEINIDRQHLENFIQYAADSAGLQEALRKLLAKRERDSVQTHKALVRLATRPKGYHSLGMIGQGKGRSKHVNRGRNRRKNQ